MATEKNTQYWGFEAEAAITDYRIVQPGTSTNQIKVATGSTDHLLGVLKPRGDGNSTVAGDSASIYAPGSVGKVEADGSTDSIARGDWLTSDANGKAVLSENPGYDSLIGFAEEACSADGDIISYVPLPQSTQNTNGLKVRKLSITAPADGSEQDSGWDLPAKAVVVGAYVDVITAESTGTTKTLDVGTDGSGSNDPDGFLNGVSVASTGVVKGTLASGGQTLGALLSADEDGAGALVPEWDVTSGGESLTYTAGSADFAELVADIYVVYFELGN